MCPILVPGSCAFMTG